MMIIDNETSGNTVCSDDHNAMFTENVFIINEVFQLL